MKYDWQVIMSHIFQHKNAWGNKNRPRRMSIHTIASVVGRDPFVILDEMEKSGLVLGYCCPDVGGAPIFYLKELRKIMTDTPTKDAFEAAREWLKTYPISKVKGFKRHATPNFTMSVPFEDEDAEYEKQINQKLKAYRDAL